MGEPVILEAVRTPIGKRNGALRAYRPDALYAKVLDALLERTGIDPGLIGDVVTGCVTQVGEQGANVGRLGVLLSRLPKEVPAVSLNRMCGSSQQAVHFAAQAIAAGDVDFAIAGGVESMTRVPMFADIGGGFHTLNPELGKRYELVHQGESAERIAERYGFCREELDEWGYLSHKRAARATEEGRFSAQILPLEGLDAEGRPFLLTRDEGVRPDVDYEKMLALKPVFREDGVVTAGNSSQISDGAAALLLASEEAVKAHGLKPIAKVLGGAWAAGESWRFPEAPIPAAKRLLDRLGMRVSDFGLFENNEAFALNNVLFSRLLDVPYERLNVFGGAVALGHPIGASGARILVTLLNALRAKGEERGLAAICHGTGGSVAFAVEVV